MAASETIDLKDLPSWSEELARDAQSDFTPLFKQISLVMAYHSRQWFDRSAGPDARPWLPLKRPRSGARHVGSTAKPLLDTGLLAASLSSKGQGHLDQETSTSFTWGSAVDYSGFQNDGTRFIPARPFLGFNDELLDEIDSLVADFVAERIAG